MATFRQFTISQNVEQEKEGNSWYAYAILILFKYYNVPVFWKQIWCLREKLKGWTLNTHMPFSYSLKYHNVHILYSESDNWYQQEMRWTLYTWTIFTGLKYHNVHILLTKIDVGTHRILGKCRGCFQRMRGIICFNGALVTQYKHNMY